jgi:hypothetical protein
MALTVSGWAPLQASPIAGSIGGGAFVLFETTTFFCCASTPPAEEPIAIPTLNTVTARTHFDGRLIFPSPHGEIRARRRCPSFNRRAIASSQEVSNRYATRAESLK